MFKLIKLFVQNNMSIIKVVISGHYSHISQFTYKCIVWTVIINEDEEGRYMSTVQRFGKH